MPSLWHRFLPRFLKICLWLVPSRAKALAHNARFAQESSWLNAAYGLLGAAESLTVEETNGSNI